MFTKIGASCGVQKTIKFLSSMRVGNVGADNTLIYAGYLHARKSY